MDCLFEADSANEALSANGEELVITRSKILQYLGLFRVAAGIMGALAGLTLLMAAAAASGQSVPPTFFGMHLQEQSVTWPTVPVGVYRTSATGWTHVEPSRGVFNWTELDRQVAMAAAHGAPVYYATDGLPSWFSASNLADWDAFITALATRYKGKIEVYELWNEPEYDSLPPMTVFVTMGQHMRDIVRSIDPAAKIASPGVDTVSYIASYWSAGGPKDVDFVAFHGYPKNSSPESVLQKISDMKTYMAQAGISAPIVDSEGSWGNDSYGVTTVAAKEAFIPRYELLQWAAGVTRHYWYSWDDSTSSSNGIGWGTLYDAVAHQVLPQAATYALVHDWMIGANIACSPSGNVWTCSIARPGYQAEVVWDTAGSAAFNAGQFTQATDVTGVKKAITGGSVQIGASPLLLETSGNVPVPPTQLRAVVN
jgi:hypothetical protein